MKTILASVAFALFCVACGDPSAGTDGGTGPIHVSISYYALNSGGANQCKSDTTTQCSVTADISKAELDAAGFEQAGCTVSGGADVASVDCPRNCTSQTDACGIGTVTTLTCVIPPHLAQDHCAWMP